MSEVPLYIWPLQRYLAHQKSGGWWQSRVQGYLAHKKPPHPSTLQVYVQGSIVVLGGLAVSYERGTPVRFMDSGFGLGTRG